MNATERKIRIAQSIARASETVDAQTQLADEAILHELGISQSGIVVFHRALLRPGTPQTGGDA